MNERQTTVCTIVQHRLGKVDTNYWSSVMYIHGRQMRALTFAGQRKCGAFGTVVLSAVLCIVIVVSTVVLSTVCVTS